MLTRTVITAAAMALAVPALAGHGYEGEQGYPAPEEFDYAQVVDVDPLVREVRVTVPRQECHNETRYVPVERYSDQPAAGPMILGGLVGAVIGSHLGSHRESRRAGTIAGAVIGSAIGHDAAQRTATRAEYGPEELRPIESQRCEIYQEERIEQRIDGYRVTYRYNGRLHTTRLPYDPGDRIRVRVNVDPLG